MSPNTSQPLPSRQRILIGGVGALTPLALNLLVIDFAALQTAAFAQPALLGYFVRVAVLFGLGALIAYFHDDETNKIKLYQLGLGVPALAVAFLNGQNVKLPDVSADLRGPTFSVLEHAALAQSSPTDKGFKHFTMPPPSGTKAFWQGVLGRPADTTWFVIAGSHPNAEEATTQANELRNRGLSADVYLPYAKNKSYAVVLGGNLTREDAESLKGKAIGMGAPKESYLWTFAKKKQ